MTSINEMNAVKREQARIRKAVIKCPMLDITLPTMGGTPNESHCYVRLGDVLKLLHVTSAYSGDNTCKEKHPTD